MFFQLRVSWKCRVKYFFTAVHGAECCNYDSQLPLKCEVQLLTSVYVVSDLKKSSGREYLKLDHSGISMAIC